MTIEANVASTLSKLSNTFVDVFGDNWKGTSFTSIRGKVESFASDFGGPIDGQIKNFNNAVEELTKLIGLKDDLKKAEAALCTAESNLKDAVQKNDSAAAGHFSELISTIKQDISNINADIEKKRKEINDLLEQVMNGKLDAVEAKSYDCSVSGMVTGMNGVSSGGASASTSDVVNNAMNWAIGIANDNRYTYDWGNLRWGVDNHYDCSSLLITAFENAGIPVKEAGATYTGDMKEAFESQGFTWIQGPVNVSDLQPGDVLLNEASHTEMYIGDGMNVGAHWYCHNGSYDNDIDVEPYWDDNWDGVLRYTGNK